jgi:hypothetical protein
MPLVVIKPDKEYPSFIRGKDYNFRNSMGFPGRGGGKPGGRGGDGATAPRYASKTGQKRAVLTNAANLSETTFSENSTARS